MPRLRASDLRGLSMEELRLRLEELREELVKVKAAAATGGSMENPARIGQIKKDIARVLTVMRENELKILRGKEEHA
ncbi:MAG: 50S ribosomal protein L29 [Methanobacteriota archaeon]|nr:MAG: 50S ribosomal protein L29 [Euryarchaeota archaeon]